MIDPQPDSADLSKNLPPGVVDELKRLGIAEFGLERAEQIFSALDQAIKIGLTREGPSTETDGGVLAIRTGVPVINGKDWQAVPDGSNVISLSFGGTNISTSYMEKVDDTTLTEEYTRSLEMEEQARAVTVDQFVDLMAEQIARVAFEGSVTDIEAVAISLGFPHRNIIDENGNIDAQIFLAEPAKFWRLDDFADYKAEGGPRLGQKLLKALQRRGLKYVEHFYFENDTKATEDDLTEDEMDIGADTDLEAGFCFGTGDNSSLRDVNLELGRARILEPDVVLYNMALAGLVPFSAREVENNNLLEFWMGGDYIRYRAATALKLLANYGSGELALLYKISEFIQTTSDKAILSKLAKGSVSLDELAQLVTVNLGQVEYDLARYCAATVLLQAGELMGMIKAAVSNNANYQEKSGIKIEGSVYWKGYGVAKKANAVLDYLLPDNRLVPYEANGRRGVAKLAMTQMAKPSRN